MAILSIKIPITCIIGKLQFAEKHKKLKKLGIPSKKRENYSAHFNKSEGRKLSNFKLKNSKLNHLNHIIIFLPFLNKEVFIIDELLGCDFKFQ